MDDEGPDDRPGDDRDGEGEDGEEWRFSLSEVGPDADGSAEEPDRGPIEPQSVTPEHAAFVLVGVALTLVVILTAL